MKKIDLRPLPDFVARPSGVWNSRAPLQNYLRHLRRLGRMYSCNTLTLARVSFETSRIHPTVSPKPFFRVKRMGEKIGRAWISLRRNSANNSVTIADLQPMFKDAFFAMTEYVLLRYTSLFELFIQCWALNYILAKLEIRSELSSAERRFIRRCLPFLKEPNIPSQPTIFQALPEAKDWLRTLPHISTDPRTHEPVVAPLTSLLNAFEVIEFWRAYRNLVVHRAGVVSQRFLDKYGEFFEQFAATFPYMPSLKLGRPIEHSDSLIVALSTVHEKAAVFLNQRLADISSGRRGMPTNMMLLDLTTNGPPMVQPGDHEESFLWSCDVGYRTSIRKRAEALIAAT